MKLKQIQKWSRTELEEKCAEMDVVFPVDTRPSDDQLRELLVEKYQKLGVTVEDDTRDKTGKVVNRASISPNRVADTADVLRAERKVKIKILRNGRSMDAVPVSINGYQFRIQTGIEVDVPVSVYKVLMQSVEWKFDPENPKAPPMEVQSYPVQLIDAGL